MGVDWYDMIARRNGGYRGRAVTLTEGKSAEEIFEERLVSMLPRFSSVLDAGCGHGEFTLKMSKYTKTSMIIGFDNSIELIKIARALLTESGIRNVEFIYATTKAELPFEDGQFDLIFDRRGPTSIINHSRVLSTGGTIFGIHNSIDVAKERLINNGFTSIEIEEFNSSISYFPSEIEFAKFLSDIPGNPDYTLPEMSKELEKKIDENIIDGRLGVKEHKYIWKAKKP